MCCTVKTCKCFLKFNDNKVCIGILKITIIYKLTILRENSYIIINYLIMGYNYRVMYLYSSFYLQHGWEAILLVWFCIFLLDISHEVFLPITDTTMPVSNGL